jgi:hypothetical protein
VVVIACGYIKASITGTKQNILQQIRMGHRHPGAHVNGFSYSMVKSLKSNSNRKPTTTESIMVVSRG